jgi:hypothetical protein
VIHTELSPEADGKLEVVWVKAYNFLDIARKEDIVMEVAYVVGDPEEVDITSLNSRGPLRVKISCREVSIIRGETQVFSMERVIESDGIQRNLRPLLKNL